MMIKKRDGKMKQYAALLRGINISGKNKIEMAALKQAFTEAGYLGVRTHLNSGNVLFFSEKERELLSAEITELIESRFGYRIPVYVLEEKKLKELLEKAPDWWGTDDKEIYDNLIFLFPPHDFEELHQAIGEPEKGLERIESAEEAVFWSFDLKRHQKTNWWPKTSLPPAKDWITIRTANTMRKILAMMEKEKTG